MVFRTLRQDQGKHAFAQVTIIDGDRGDCCLIDMCQKREDGQWGDGPIWIRTLIDTGMRSEERRTAIKNALQEVTIPLPANVQGTADYVPPLSEIQLTHTDEDHVGNIAKLMDDVANIPAITQPAQRHPCRLVYADMIPLIPTTTARYSDAQLFTMRAPDDAIGITFTFEKLAQWRDGILRSDFTIITDVKPQGPLAQLVRDNHVAFDLGGLTSGDEATICVGIASQFLEGHGWWFNNVNTPMVDFFDFILGFELWDADGYRVDGTGGAYHRHEMRFKFDPQVLLLRSRLTINAKDEMSPDRNAFLTPNDQNQIHQFLQNSAASSWSWWPVATEKILANIEARLGRFSVPTKDPHEDIARYFNVQHPIRNQGNYVSTEIVSTAGIFDYHNYVTQRILGPNFKIQKRLLRFYLIQQMIEHQNLKAAAQRRLFRKDPIPPEGYNSLVNRASVVTLFHREDLGLQMLFTGDAYDTHCDIRDTLAAWENPEVEEKPMAHFHVLKIPHHGSQVTADIDFYRRVTADVYIICGAHRRQGNPTYPTLKAIVASFRGRSRPGGEPFRLFFSDADAYEDTRKYKSAAKLIHTSDEYAPNAAGPYNYKICYPRTRLSSYPIYFYQDGFVNVNGTNLPVMREKCDPADWFEI